jgi:hypothetical protein
MQAAEGIALDVDGIAPSSQTWKRKIKLNNKVTTQIHNTVTTLSACPNKARQAEGTVHQEFVPAALMVNHHYYREVLQCLREEIHQKCPQRWGNRTGLFAVTMCWCTLLCKCSAIFGRQKHGCGPPHSLLISYGPHDFFLFPIMKFHFCILFIWTLSIVQFNKIHNVWETGSVSIFRW